MANRIRKIEKHTWCADIMSPFETISKNIHVSNQYEKFFCHVIAFYDNKKMQSVRSGTQVQEGKSSPYGYKIHNGDLINNEF